VFTQCSKCETVFKLSADVLRAAGGQVRCGKCGEVFNALAHLAEDASAFAAGESAIDLEARADRILESVSSAPPSRRTPTPTPTPKPKPTPPERPPPEGVEIARLQILEWSGEELTQVPEPPPDEAEQPLGEASMEFTLPPGELDRIFVEFKAGKRRAIAPGGAAMTFDPMPHPEDEAKIKAAQAASIPSGFDVPDEIRRDMLSGMQPPPALEAPPAHPAFVSWLLAALAAGLLLAGQIIHQNREWLSSHAPFGGILSAVYARIGAPVALPANLSAYQLRQWGITGDPTADGTLRVRASILNTAAQPEPYPLLRVTLANRFGGAIGTRDFEAAEYLGKPVARLLVPGQRIDATMDILDPGKSAEGFEIDVCLRGADKKVSCANDAVAAQNKR
jgi:predicted Zn finger-like uncharacterized protein